jgi:hypothetical protein
MSDIIDTMDMPEGEFEEDIAATTESQPQERLEFFVQMRGYTLREMDAMIVEAAARQIVGSNRDRELAKEIEKRCIELTAAKVDAKLASVTSEIIDQPMIPAFGSSKEPVTMREFMALCGREYLAEKVGNDGKPYTGSSYHDRSMTRMQYLVRAAVDVTFKKEIESATNAAIRSIQETIRAEHVAVLEAEKARIREAVSKATA